MSTCKMKQTNFNIVKLQKNHKLGHSINGTCVSKCVKNILFLTRDTILMTMDEICHEACPGVMDRQGFFQG